MIIVPLLDDETIWRVNGRNFCLINNNIDLKYINRDKKKLIKYYQLHWFLEFSILIICLIEILIHFVVIVPPQLCVSFVTVLIWYELIFLIDDVIHLNLSVPCRTIFILFWVVILDEKV